MKTHYHITYIIVALVILLGAKGVWSWTAPTQSAPGGDTAPSLNASLSIQKKIGSLGLGGINVFGTTTFAGTFTIADGTQGAGKILISDAQGVASWVTPPPYDANGVCPANTVTMSDGQCGYKYTLSSGGYIFCSPGDERISWYDSGIGRNHGAVAVDPNGCYSWEGRHNNGGPGCTIACVGHVKMCLKFVNGEAEWSLSGPDKICH